MTAIIPNQFFTPESIATLTGATGAVFVITNGLSNAIGFKKKWFGLAVSLMIAMLGVHLSDGPKSQYFIAVINGFLIYATAGGTTHAIANMNPKDNESDDIARPQGLKKRNFLSSWW